jgi:hypothetical protein
VSGRPGLCRHSFPFPSSLLSPPSPIQEAQNWSQGFLLLLLPPEFSDSMSPLTPSGPAHSVWWGSSCSGPMFSGWKWKVTCDHLLRTWPAWAACTSHWPRYQQTLDRHQDTERTGTTGQVSGGPEAHACSSTWWPLNYHGLHGGSLSPSFSWFKVSTVSCHLLGISLHALVLTAVCGCVTPVLTQRLHRLLAVAEHTVCPYASLPRTPVAAVTFLPFSATKKGD